MAGGRRKPSFGPGFLVTAAFIGPGTVTTCSLAGARFGTALLFTLVFATATTVVLQTMAGRLSLGAKLDLAQSLRDFPRSRATRLFNIVITLCAITFGCAAYEAGNIVGGALGLESVTGLHSRIWVGLISLLAVLILSRKGIKSVETTLIILVFVMSFSFLATLVIIGPDPSEILRGLVPSFPSGSLVLILALIGTTVVPYNLFLHSAAVRAKWRGAEDLPALRKDLVLSVGLGGLISMAIVITSAAAFYARNLTLESGGQMAQQLDPLLGSSARILFGLGFLAAGLSSAVTAPYAAAFASSGVLGWREGTGSRRFKAVWLGVILIGLAVSLLGLNPISVILFAQVANGLVLPVATIFLLISLNNRERMGVLANSAIQNAVGVIITLIVIGLGAWNILKIFL